MTAEITIMNKKGIAVASDSAVTISNSNNSDKKIYNSANKLFMLSKHHPVGIMVYGNAEMNGVPWETIIKYYRSKLDLKPENTIEDYAKSFISFLRKGKNPIFVNDNQKIWAEIDIYSALNEIFNYINANFIKMAPVNQKNEKEKKKIINSSLKELEKMLLLFPKITKFSETNEKKIFSDYGSIYKNSKLQEINHLITKTNNIKITALCKLMVSRTIFLNGFSGIAIFGFGEEEFYPTQVSYKIGWKYGTYLKYEFDDINSHKITLFDDVAIIPLAQDDVVATFLDGIEPEYRRTLIDNYGDLVLTQIESVLQKSSLKNSKELETIKSKLNKEILKIKIEYKNSMEIYEKENQSGPISKIVKLLPINEMADFAESLVNITSIKRKVSNKDESVGGPVDVAVITKGDGFIWIKRKHYFDPKFNHQFFDNYYD